MDNSQRKLIDQNIKQRRLKQEFNAFVKENVLKNSECSRTIQYGNVKLHVNIA